MMKERSKIFTSLLLASALAFAGCGDGGNIGGSVDVDSAVGSEQSAGSASSEESVLLSEDEVLEKLISTPYKTKIRAGEKYGVEDLSALGADEKAFSTVKYPAPADGDCAFVYRAEDYGITTDADDNAEKINALLNSIRNTEGVKKVVFGSGEYKISAPIKIYHTDGLYICGANDGGRVETNAKTSDGKEVSDTQFTVTKWASAFDVYNCTDLHFNGISVDYVPSPTVAGRTVRCDTSAKTITMRLYDEFDLSLPEYAGDFVYGSYMEFKTDDLTGELIPDADGNLLYNQAITGKSYNADKKQLTLSFSYMKEVEVGTPVAVAFTMYNSPCVQITESKDVYVEGVNVYTSPGMAFVCISDRNVYFNRANVMRKIGSSRLMTATADGIHCKDGTGALEITGCLLEYSHDDSINICNFYKTVTAIDGNTLYCRSTSADFDFPLERGNTIDFYRAADYSYAGTFKVKAVVKDNLNYTVTLDGAPQGVAAGDLVGNASRVPRVKIENNIFRNKRNRGILAQFRNSRIVNNTFMNIVHGAVQLHSLADMFREAIVPRDVEIVGNKFIANNTGYGLSGDVAVIVRGASGYASGTVTGITVRNNFFYRSSLAGVYMSAAGSSSVTDNYFCDIGVRASGETLAAVSLNTSENITVSGNYIRVLTERPGFTDVYERDVSGLIKENNTLR